MKLDRKTLYLQNRIKDLNRQLSEISKQNKVIEEENQSLKRIVDAKDASIAALLYEIREMRESYSSAMEELIKLKTEYEKLIAITKETKKKYDQEIKRFIKKIKR